MKSKLILCFGLCVTAGFFVSACDKERIQEDELVTKGRELFRDVKFSTNRDQSCETCHPNGHMDNRKWHFPAIHGFTNGKPDSLRTLTLWGVAEQETYLWTNRRMTLAAITRLYADTIMGGGATNEEIAALVAYQRSLVFPKNPNLSSDGKLTPAQQRGKELYLTDIKGNCAPCHIPPVYSSPSPKNIGTGGTFKTSGIRAIYSMAPYFHDGRAKTLREVIDFYAGQLLVNLSPDEREDLVEYLKTL